MKVHFYEIREPYSAVIKAHNEFEVLKVYEEIVSSISDKEKFFQDLKVISDRDVRTQLAGCHIDTDTTRLMTPKEQEESFNQKAPSIILMEQP